MLNKPDDSDTMSDTELQNRLLDANARLLELESEIRKKSDHLTENQLKLKKTSDELNYTRHQLLEREAKLNSILNASIEGIIVINKAGIIVSVNSAVEKIFGFNAEELIDNSISLLMPIAMRKNQDYYLEKYLRIYIPKAIGQIREVEGLRKDGTLVPLDLTIAEFPLDGVQYFSGIVRDVSARKSPRATRAGTPGKTGPCHPPWPDGRNGLGHSPRSQPTLIGGRQLHPSLHSPVAE